MAIGRFIALAAFLILFSAGCGEIVKTLTERAPVTETPDQASGSNRPLRSYARSSQPSKPSHSQYHSLKSNSGQKEPEAYERDP